MRNTLPDNTIQGTTLRPWTIGVTVSQVLFNGFKTANSVRVAEFQVLSGREALRNTGQGVLLDAVTAYMNVLANQALVESQRTNVTVLREIQASTKKRLEAGDVTPTDTAQAEARLSRGLADLNAAEVAFAISKATYAQVIGEPPPQLVAATPVDRLSPITLGASIETANHEHPAVLGAGYDVDIAQTSIKVAESSAAADRFGPGERQPRRSRPDLHAHHDRQLTRLRFWAGQRADLRRRHGGLANPTGQGSDVTEPHGARAGQEPVADGRRQRLGIQ